MTDYEERAASIVLIAIGLLLVAALLWALAGRAAAAPDALSCLLDGVDGPVSAILSDYIAGTFTRLDDAGIAALRAVPVVGAARAIYGDDPHWEAGGERLELLPGWDVWLDRAGIANTGRADAYLEVSPLAGRDDALLAVAADSRLADADGAWHGCAAWLLDAAGWYGWLAESNATQHEHVKGAT